MASVTGFSQYQRPPSTSERIGSAFGAGIGKGISDASSMALQARMSEMFVQREADKNLPMARVLAKRLGGIPEDQIEGVSQMLARDPQGMMTLIQELPMRQGINDVAGGGIPANRLFGTESQGQEGEQFQGQPQSSQQVSGVPLQTPSSLTQARAPEPIPMKIAKGTVGPQNITQEMAAQAATPSVEESVQSVQAPNATPRVPQQQPGQQTSQAQPQSQDTVRWENITPEQLQRYTATLPVKQAKMAIDAWNKAQDRALRERTASAAERKATVAERKEERESGQSELKMKEARPDVKKLRERMGALREQVRKYDESFKDAKKAIQTGDTNNWGQFFVNKFDVDPLKAPATQLMNVASKEFIRGSMMGISAKAQNQWIEQRFASMFPTAGSRADSQETVLASLQRSNDISRKEIELYDKYDEQYARDPQKIDKAVQSELRKYTDERDDKLSYHLSLIKDKYATSGDIYGGDRATQGEYITPKKLSAFIAKNQGDKARAIKQLLELGYRAPTTEQLYEWKDMLQEYSKP